MAIRFLNTATFTGNVGIGTNTPETKLDVNGIISLVGQKFAKYDSTNDLFIVGDLDGAGAELALSVDTGEAVRINATKALKFNAYGAGTLRSDASGNITSVTSGAGTGTVTGTGVNNRLAIWNGTTAIKSDSNFFTTGAKLVSTQFSIGDGTDGEFFSDTAGRTAFRNGSFYIQSSVPNYFNYATNQYYGATSGDNLFFRGNALTGDNWLIKADGTIEAERGFTTDGLGKSFTWTVNNTTSSSGYKKIMNWYPAGQSSRMTITASGGLGYGNGGDDDSGLANAVFTVNNGNLLSGSWWFEGADGIINFYWKQISTSPYQYEIYIQHGEFSEFALQAVTSDGYMVVASTTSTPNSWTTLTKKWNVNNQLYLNNAGNVSIGTTTVTDNRLKVIGGSDYQTLNIGESQLNSTIKRSGLTAVHYTVAEQDISMMSVFSSSTSTALSIGGSAGTLNAAMDIRFFTASNTTTVTGTQRMTIRSSGNVGIGTNEPTSKLHVSGGTSIQTTLTIGADGTNNDKSSKLFFNEGEAGATDSKDYGFSLAYDGSAIAYPGLAGNEFGIIRHNNSANGDVVMKMARTNNNTTFTGIVTASGLALRSGSTTYFSVSTFSGSPYINTGTSGGTITLGAPAAFVTNLNVAGTATATNFILSSDERLKENIKTLEPRKIDIKWKSFNLKTDDDYRTGVIAQELEKTNPEFVREDSKGFKSVAYIDLLIAKIAELEARLEKAGI